MLISPQAPVAAVESDLGEVQQLRDQITELTEQVAALTTQRPASQRKSSIRCFNCDGIGHVIVPAHVDVDQTLDPAIIVADLDTLPEIVISSREMRKGRLQRAAGVPAISEPRRSHCCCH